MNDRISAPLVESRLPVGSSAKMIVRTGGEGPGDGDALLLAAGELRRAMRRAGRRRPTVSTTWSNQSRSALRPARRSGQRDVLGGGQRRHQVERLEDEADAVAAQLRELGGRSSAARSMSPIERLPEVSVSSPASAVHERRLAGAGRPHDRGEAAGGELDDDARRGRVT